MPRRHMLSPAISLSVTETLLGNLDMLNILMVEPVSVASN